jgi:hypothetical protein
LPDTTTTIITTVEITEASKFRILNAELSLPLKYYNNSFIFSLTYAIPFSSDTITTGDGEYSEDYKKRFYFSAGISYWFYPKKIFKASMFLD